VAKKTAFLLHYDMLDNLKLLGNDVTVEVLTALSKHDQGMDIGALSPQAQFAVNAYVPALNKAKSRWKASVANGGGTLFDSLDEPNPGLDEAGCDPDEPRPGLAEASCDLDEPGEGLEEASPGLEAGVPVPVPVHVPENLHEPENPDDFPDRQDFSTAVAVTRKEPGKTALIPSRSRSPPSGSKKTALSPKQLALFHAAKAAFEANEKTRAIMYQDRESTARYMKNLKTLAIRCANMVPDASGDFLRNILEHFSVMCVSGRFRDKASFTPQSLITGFVWEKVIDSLPEAESPELQKLIRGMFR